MLKVLSPVLLALSLAGCQSLVRPSDFDSPMVSLRCMVLAEKESSSREILTYIRSYAGYGNAMCKAQLGKFYRDGRFGRTQDFGKARELFIEAAAVNPNVNVLLGRMAERGEGEPVDYSKARELYRLSGNSAVIPLGRLMEEGKGGPEDRPGALALYLASTKTIGDDTWKEVSRLRRQGQQFDEAQTQRYEQIWTSGFLTLQRRVLAVREVYDAVNAAGGTRHATLSYRFRTDSGVPEITMLEGSGDANVDHWILKAASRLSMRDAGPITDSSGVREFKTPFELSPTDTRGMRWMCGGHPCG